MTALENIINTVSGIVFLLMSILAGYIVYIYKKKDKNEWVECSEKITVLSFCIFAFSVFGLLLVLLEKYLQMGA